MEVGHCWVALHTPPKRQPHFLYAITDGQENKNSHVWAAAQPQAMHHKKTWLVWLGFLDGSDSTNKPHKWSSSSKTSDARGHSRMAQNLLPKIITRHPMKTIFFFHAAHSLSGFQCKSHRGPPGDACSHSHVCTHVCTLACMYACMHVRLHLHVRTLACMYACMYVRLQSLACTYTAGG